MGSVRATVYQTPSPSRLEVLERAVIAFDDAGVITDVTPDAERAISAETQLADDVVLVPGLVDCHVHAPQWPQLGTGLDLPLDRWLFEYTFPLEARYADPEFACRVWDDLVPGLLAHGTTTASTTAQATWPRRPRSLGHASSTDNERWSAGTRWITPMALLSGIATRPLDRRST